MDEKEVIFVLKVTFQDLLKCFEDIYLDLSNTANQQRQLRKIKHSPTICCLIILMIPTWGLFLFFSEVFFEINFPQCPVHIKSQP